MIVLGRKFQQFSTRPKQQEKSKQQREKSDTAASYETRSPFDMSSRGRRHVTWRAYAPCPVTIRNPDHLPEAGGLTGHGRVGRVQGSALPLRPLWRLKIPLWGVAEESLFLDPEVSSALPAASRDAWLPLIRAECPLLNALGDFLSKPTPPFLQAMSDGWALTADRMTRQRAIEWLAWEAKMLHVETSLDSAGNPALRWRHWRDQAVLCSAQSSVQTSPSSTSQRPRCEIYTVI